jgi:hypothetical protein
VLFDMLGAALVNPAIDMFLVWNTRWILNGERPELWDIFDPRNEFTTIGRPMAIWGKYALDLMVRAEGQGSVRAYASRSADGRKLAVFLINRGLAPAEAGVEVAGLAAGGVASRWVFSGAGPEDLSPSWSVVGQVAAEDGVLKAGLPAVSVTVLELDS